MNFMKTVAKGIVISFIMHLIFATVMVKMDFDLSLANFSVLLILMMAIVSLYVGAASEKMGAVTGVVVALGTAAMLLLYLNQRIEMNWELNRYIIAIYLLDGFVFAFLGSLFFKKKSPADRAARTKPQPNIKRETPKGRRV